MTPSHRRLAIISLGGPPDCGENCDHFTERRWADGDHDAYLCQHSSVMEPEADLTGYETWSGRVIESLDARPGWCPLMTEKEEA